MEKSLFIENWFQNKNNFVNELFYNQGLLLTYEELLSKFNIPVAPLEYAKGFLSYSFWHMHASSISTNVQ